MMIEYDSGIHYIKPICKKKDDFLYHINSVLSDYYGKPTTEEIALLFKKPKKHIAIKEPLARDISAAMKEHEQKIITEVYDIVNYIYFLIISEQTEYTIPEIRKIGMAVLALRLARLNERETVLKAERALKERGEAYGTNRIYSRAVYLSSEIFMGYNKVSMRAKKITGGKELQHSIKAFYNGAEITNKLLLTIRSLSETFSFTNAPYEFIALFVPCKSIDFIVSEVENFMAKAE
jgi:hypothetical protein